MTFYTATITLILVMDPLGNVPVFLSILKRFDAKTQVRIILRETAIAFVILSVFLFFGQYIMKGLHIEPSALSIAGGIILFLISLRMIFPPESRGDKEDEEEEPFIVPLAVPLTAGPSALAMVLLFVSRDPSHIWNWFAAIVISTIFFLIVLLGARTLMNLLGKRGLTAIERLMGMILTTVSVQMLLSGVVQYMNHPNLLQ